MRYRIHLHSHLPEGCSRYFDGTAIEQAPGGTTMLGLVQLQAALRGVPAMVRDLGLVLRSVESCDMREV